MDRRGVYWWETRWFVAIAVLIACLPLFWPTIPPLTDIPGHIGRYRVMLDDGTGPLARWYTFEWRWVGNMGAELLVAGLRHGLEVESATKLVALMTVALTVIGFFAISRAAHNRVSPYALFALPLVYNHPFHTGFLNFSLAIALAFNGLALWIRLERYRWRSIAFVPLSLVVYTVHIFGYAVLALLAFAAELARTRQPVVASLACWPFAFPFVLLVLAGSGGQGVTVGFFDIHEKLILVLRAFRDRWFWLDLATLEIIIIVFLTARKCHATMSPTLSLGTLSLAVAFLLLPSWLFGSAFADMRLVPFVFILALLALAPTPEMTPRSTRAIALAGFAFFIARIAVSTVSLALVSDHYDRALAGLDHVPRGSRIASLVSPNCANPWAMTRLDHLGGLAIAAARLF